MKQSYNSCVLLMFVALIPAAFAQWKEAPSTGSPTFRLPDRTTLAGQTGLGPVLTAKLVDKAKNATQHKAVVAVQTDGVILVDSGTEEQPRLDHAHIQYRLDNGKVVNTTSTTWTIDNLQRGHHRIDVCLAANDSKKIGRATTLIVDIP